MCLRLRDVAGIRIKLGEGMRHLGGWVMSVWNTWQAQATASSAIKTNLQARAAAAVPVCRHHSLQLLRCGLPIPGPRTHPRSACVVLALSLKYFVNRSTPFACVG
jgi:hypothetical protein